MEAIVPYLTFKGNAGEALAFYSKALNGAVLFQQKFGDSPMEVGPEYKDKIMHATFKAGDLTIMASDENAENTVSLGNSVNLSLNFTDIESIEKIFKALSEGATVTMPLQDTFWGARFGMLTDKFGFHWMFNHDIKNKDK